MSHLTLAASLLPIAFILISHSLLARTVSVPLQNITITAPIGTSQHGDAHLLCVPTGTWDVIVFFLGNYIAHAFTVRAYPGESLIDFTWATIAALFLPTSGIIRGATGIIRGTTGILRKGFVARTPLEMAARAGALCMVVRTKDWKPHPGFQLSQIGIRMIDPAKSATQSMPALKYLKTHRTLIPATYRTYVPPWLKDVSFGSFLPDTLVVLTGTRKIRGNQKLLQGYAFAFVPSDTRVVPLDNGDGHTVPPPKKGLLKGLVALGQAAYGSYTLVMSLGGDQISQYGYAAFGLTVIPYAAMSIVNLIGVLVHPGFDELYLVQSDTLLEARRL
ncbi:hypothetical protein B0H11DRAFT_1767456, partial [Mycena galericulata]